ncbi:putative holin-like toxin [Liquorilactobacillus sucicola]
MIVFCTFTITLIVLVVKLIKKQQNK